MAVTQDTYTGDNSRLQFPFTFPYLQKSDVKVKLDGTTQATTEYFWHNATTIQMNTAPASGVVVIIYRDTNNDAKKGTFYAGSMIKAEDLNDNFDQILYVAQEVSNNAMSTLGTAQMQGNMEFGKGMGIVFEGSTADAFETTLNVVDPTADRSLNLPNVDGTLISTGDTGTVTGTMLANATITGLDIANDTIDSQHYAAGSVDLEHMSANSIDSDQYVDGSIDRVHLAADIVDGTKIADNAINSEHITAGSVDLAHMSANSIDSDQYVDGSIDLVHMSANSVSTDQYVDDSIEQVHLKANSVDSENYVDGSIDGEHIANDQIDSQHYAAGSIDLEHMSANSVDSDQYVDGSIDRVHLSADIIDATKIEDDAVQTEHLQNARLTTLSGMNSVTASTLAAASELNSTIDEIDGICDGMTKQATITDSDVHYPTSGAVVDYVEAQLLPFGGFEVIADEDNFPSTQPVAGVVVSISDAGGIVVQDGSGVAGRSTTARTAGNGSDNVTINNFPTTLQGTTLAAGIGLMVSSTGSSQTYNYHKILGKEDDIKQLSDDINDFKARYRIASSAPGSSNDAGDLYYDTSANRMKVYNATTSAWDDVAQSSSSHIVTLSEAFDGSRTDFTMSTAATDAQSTIVSINGVIQKPNAGTSTPSEGFAISSNTLKLSNAPATGSDYFVVVLGDTVSIGTPSDNTVDADILQSGCVTTAKIVDDAVTAAKIGDLDADVKWLDGKKAILGTGSDIQLYHDNTNSVNLLKAYNHPFKLQTNNDDDAIVCNQNGSVELYYDNSKKFVTQSGGVRVFGDLENHNDDFVAKDNCKFLAGNSGDLEIYHDGSNSYITNGTGILRVRGSEIRLCNTDNETYFMGAANGAAKLYYDDEVKFETTSGGIEISGTTATQKLTATNTYSATDTTQCGYQIQNLSDTTDTYAALRLTAGTSSPATAQIASVRKGAGQNDLTFQVEASNTAKEVMRMASNGRVGIGVSSPNRTLDIQTASNENGFSLNCIGTPANYAFDIRDDGTVIYRVDNAGRVLIGTETEGDTTADNLTIADSGSCGITIRSGTSSEGNIYFSDATSGSGEYTGMVRYEHNNNALVFKTNTAERLRIDSGGKVGISTSAPGDYYADKLVVDILDNEQSGITIVSDSTKDGMLAFADGTSGDERYRGYVNYDHNIDTLTLGTEGTARVHVDADTTQVDGKFKTVQDANERAGLFHNINASQTVGTLQSSSNRNTTNGTYAHFWCTIEGTGDKLYIWDSGTVDNATNSYGQISDQRLKENIVDASSQWNDIKNLKVRNFNFKENTTGDTFKQIGLVAQEAELVSPGLVEEKKWMIGGEENQYKTVKYSILYMKAIKALQEAMAKIETLETKVAALEAA